MKKIYQEVLKIKRIITAVGNQKINKELKNNYNVPCNDIFYKEGVLEYLEKNNQIDYIILEENIPGITGEMTWERTYNYGSLFKSILGTVSNIPKEERNDYLNKGYELTDVVGISYLEKEYEDILKGTKNKYEIDDNGEYKLVEAGKRGMIQF